MRIGLVAPTSEAEAALVADRLRARGAEPFLLDLSTFPSSSRVSIHVAQSVRILHEGRDIADASAWFVRRFASTAPLMRTPPTVPEGPALHGRLLEWAVAEDEKSVFVGSLLALLAERAPLVNPPHAFEGHFRKHHAAFLLRKAGLRVPEFVTGNDPVALREFLARHGRAVHKPTSGGRHVKEVTRERLDARAEALATEPVVLQRLVEGRHVRAYVVADRLVGAAEVLFDRAKGVDYRASEQGVARLELAADVAEACVRACRASGMEYTGLDLILDADDEPWFLECNPAPRFASFERRSGVPVSAAIAERLVEVAKGA